MAKKSKKDDTTDQDMKPAPAPGATVPSAPAPSASAAGAPAPSAPSPGTSFPGASAAKMPASTPTVALAGDVSLDGSADAPFIYFENVSVSGHMNGIVRVTLEAVRLLPGENNTVYADRVIVGHLRMNMPAAQSLRNALDRALLMASKPASREMN